MVRSAVTISLVEEARGGPFVFWDGLAAGCQAAARLGFDAVEVFPPSAKAVDAAELKGLLAEHGLQLAAVGTGAGKVKHGLTLSDPDPARREEALTFVRTIIDLAGPFKAPAIIGSMQGTHGGPLDRAAALELLAAGLSDLGEYARQYGAPLIYEPLNRYETNLVNTLADGVKLIAGLAGDNVRLLADLFHMNIEESDVGAALREAGPHVGHLHFVDSNRQAAGRGHLDYGPIAAALEAIRFDGYASAEALPLPDSETAARQTMEAFRTVFR